MLNKKETPSKSVFVHTQTESGKGNWVNQSLEFLRLPIVGEYIALSMESQWYRVDLVVHCPFDCEYVAELYATKVDYLETMKLAIG